jgi:3-dehydroquinate synthetase
VRELLRPVILLGPPGAGKSAAGRRAATRLGLRFIDLDSLIVDREGRALPALLEAGEASFRLAEMSALQSVLEDREPSLVAAGAGITTTEPARALLRRRARLMLLDVDPAVALRRLADGEPRPLLGDDQAEWPERYALLEEPRRDPRETLCTDVIDTSEMNVDEVADELVHRLERADSPVVAGQGAVSLMGVTFCSEDAPPSFSSWTHGHAAVMVIDDGVPEGPPKSALLEAWGDEPVITVAGGEEAKNLEGVARVADELADLELPPDGTVVAVGGGAVLDRVGFVASALNRGVRWVSVPTTLLSMVDASVGGKTAVNLRRGKNLFGAFWPPRATLIDPRFLNTLGPRARVAGVAEMLKHAFLVADAPADGSPAEADEILPAIAKASADLEQTRAAIRRAIAIKASVVAADPRERGLRRALNLGHTLGHALEQESLVGRHDGRLLHGEAVAWGLRFSIALSRRVAGLDEKVAERLSERVSELGLVDLPEMEPGRLLDRMRVDKKRRRSGVAFVVLEAPGRPAIARDPDRADVEAALEETLGGA